MLPVREPGGRSFPAAAVDGGGIEPPKVTWRFAAWPSVEYCGCSNVTSPRATSSIMPTAKPSKSTTSSAKGSSEGGSAAELIDKRIAELDDWRGEALSRMRTLIKEADPDVVEEWKWAGPVWSHDGIICTGESYKSTVKLTFAKGASLNDPAKLFNSSLDGNARRAIDIHEGEAVNAEAFKALIREAVAHNTSGGKAPPKRAK